MNCNSAERRFTCTKADLKAIVAFASKDQTRPHLNAVHFDPPNGCMVATDGHRLAKVKNCGAYDGAPFNVALADMQRAIKACGSKDTVTFGRTGRAGAVTGESDNVAIIVQPDGIEGARGACLDVRHVDAAYPPYEQVSPVYSGSESERKERRAVGKIGFNAHYLAALAPIADVCSGRTGGIVCELPENDLGPALFTAHDVDSGSNWSAVIMPMRI